MQGFGQYNSCHGCPLCLYPGEWIRQSKNRRGGCIKYPLLKKIPKFRNLKETKIYCETATETKPVLGVKSKSPLLN